MIGLVGVLVQLGAGDHRRPLVEQADDGADQAGLALAALAEQDDVVAGEQGALEVGQHGVVEADDAGEARACPARIRASRLSRSSSLTAALDVAGGAQLAEGGGQVARPAVHRGHGRAAAGSEGGSGDEGDVDALTA